MIIIVLSMLAHSYLCVFSYCSYPKYPVFLLNLTYPLTLDTTTLKPNDSVDLKKLQVIGFCPQSSRHIHFTSFITTEPCILYN